MSWDEAQLYQSVLPTKMTGVDVSFNVSSTRAEPRTKDFLSMVPRTTTDCDALTQRGSKTCLMIVPYLQLRNFCHAGHFVADIFKVGLGLSNACKRHT